MSFVVFCKILAFKCMVEKEELGKNSEEVYFMNLSLIFSSVMCDANKQLYFNT